MKLRRRRRVKAFPQKRSQLGGCGLPPGIWVQGFAPPSAFGRAAALPQTRQMRCWPSSERTTNPSSRRKRQDSLTPLHRPVARPVRAESPLVGHTHATPAPNLAHSGSHAETRRVLRVDGDDVFGSKIIDTIGPFQADQAVAVALAKGHRNAVSP